MPSEGLPEVADMKMIRPGLELGEIRKDRFIPSHAFALYLNKEDVNRYYDIDDHEEEAMKYLNGQSLNPEGMDIKDAGWCLITYSGISLGWAKASDGVLKNHYPKGLRINY